jgi:hypothetical protein
VNLHRNRNQTPTSAQIGGSDLGEAPSKLISSLSPSPSISSATTLLKSIPGGITCQEADLIIKNDKSGKIILSSVYNICHLKYQLARILPEMVQCSYT